MVLKIINEVSSDPRNILHYLSEKNIPKIYFSEKRIHANVSKDIIKESRLWLNDEDYMWGLKLWKTSKKWSIITEQELEELVKKAMTQKYRERNSPMFSAAKLCGATMKGNDKEYYKSVKQGKSCVWKKIEKSKSKKKSKSRKKSKSKK